MTHPVPVLQACARTLAGAHLVHMALCNLELHAQRTLLYHLERLLDSVPLTPDQAREVLGEIERRREVVRELKEKRHVARLRAARRERGIEQRPIGRKRLRRKSRQVDVKAPGSASLP
jgi:hypothetical protein